MHTFPRFYVESPHQSARELTAAALCQEISSALKEIARCIEHPESDDDLNIKDQGKLPQFGQRLKMALLEAWKDPVTDVFNVGYV